MDRARLTEGPGPIFCVWCGSFTSDLEVCEECGSPVTADHKLSPLQYLMIEEVRPAIGASLAG